MGSRSFSEWEASPLAWTISALALSTRTTARREGTTHRGSSVAFRTNDLPKPQLLAGLAVQSIRGAVGGGAVVPAAPKSGVPCAPGFGRGGRDCVPCM